MVPRISERRGLRFPDADVVRMFFKEGLHKTPGRVLEPGCGDGNNLILFSEFGWHVVGIDINEASLDNARHNLGDDGQSVALIHADLNAGMPDVHHPFDAVILPNINYYLPRAAFRRVLHDCANKLLPGGLFFIIARTCDDWRFGKGTEVERNGFLLTCTETGEAGLLNVFYSAEELLELIVAAFGPLQGLRRLNNQFDNIQNDTVIDNRNVVIWGRKS
jgi:SAM-dependent methyltransferase